MTKQGNYFKIINKFTTDLIEIKDQETLYWHTVKEVVGKLGYLDCVVYKFDPKNNTLIQSAALGIKNPKKHLIINPLVIPVGEGVTGLVAKTLKASVLNNVEKNKEYIKDLNFAGSELCVPILYEGNLYGVIDSEHPEKNNFSEEDLKVFTQIATLVGAKLANLKLSKDRKDHIDIIGQVRDIVFISNHDDKITFINKYGKKILGYSNDEISNLRIRDFVIVDGDFKTWRNEIINKLVENGEWRGRLKLKTFDQKIHNYESNATARISKEGEFLGSINVLRNIDTEILNEKQLRRHAAVFENVNDAILMFDTKAKIIECNRQAELLLGRAKKNIIGNTSAEFAANKSEWEQGLNESLIALETKGKFIGNGKIKTPDGTIIPIEVSMTLFLDKKGQPAGTIAVIRDLSEVIESRNKLFLAINQANEASQAKSDFLAAMSHEIRTPLNAIIGFSEALEMGIGSADLKTRNENLGIIASAGRQLNNLLADIIDFSKIEAGKLQYNKEAVLPSDIFKGSLPIIKNLTKEKGLNFEGIKKSDKRVLVDRLRLNQIIINFISNAAKYNKLNGSIEFGCYETSDSQLRIYVKDTGIGIPEDMEDILFSPFERLDNASSNIPGVGLGLAICKKLTEEMGGKIGYESELDKGTTFWVQFPVI